MVRWVPGTRERLQDAALDLFAARGYEQTTATDIAQAVGLTERTFFRHFSDKREVLFHGQQALTDAFLAGLDDAPPDASPIDLAVSALRSSSSFFDDERRPHSRKRQSVIDDNPALREREALKLVGLGRALGDALRDRGVDDMAADVAAQIAVMAFGIAFAHWIAEGERRSFEAIAMDVVREVSAVAGELDR
ncbi:TetR/AcrR family transcriptional regulator [Mycolicibacterium arseniciresistens]|uniref:Helix-turn-helix domain-containing protein n=1 Tax=Mycolicibacterium arseniciresistens TaxID=3062257 RepID=A0ABT8ULD2_9MYCO|nr:TetR/AcrR family transcriptional regulator [Mycolicibacterium arseniciresistens]MDO3636989.1 helix-turn-helix domain-containing protein [Mycolicibacterium arseniciresistens]